MGVGNMVGAMKEVGLIVGDRLVGEAVATQSPQNLGQSDPYSMHTRFVKIAISELSPLSETSLSQIGSSGISQHGFVGATVGADVSGTRHPWQATGHFVHG
jgi:hypothetical protein